MINTKHNHQSVLCLSMHDTTKNTMAMKDDIVDTCDEINIATTKWKVDLCDTIQTLVRQTNVQAISKVLSNTPLQLGRRINKSGIS